MAGLCRSSLELAAWERGWSREPAVPGRRGPGSAGECSSGGGRRHGVSARGGGIAAAGRGASGGGGERPGTRLPGCGGRGAMWCLALDRLGIGPVVSLGSGRWPLVSLGSGRWPLASLGSGSLGYLRIRALGCFGTGTCPGPVVTLGTGLVGSCGTGPVVSMLGRPTVGGDCLSPVTPGPAHTTVVRGWPQWGTDCRLWAPLTLLGLGRAAWQNPARSYHRWPSQPRARPVSTDLPRDIMLFQNHRPHFFRLLGLFCGAQALFWAYLAHLAFTSLRDTGYKETVLVGDRAAGLPKIGGISLNLGSDKWRYGFTGSCLTVGCLILAAGSVFSRRSVCGVVLHRGGQEVTISSHRLLGGSHSFRVPLRDLSCMAHRRQVASVIPLKVRGHRLYYLLDGRGQFHNPGLFDVTVGAYRSL